MAAVFMFYSCSDLVELKEEPPSELFRMYKEMITKIENSKEVPVLFDKLAHSFVKGNGEQLFTQEWLDEFVAATGITIDVPLDALNELASATFSFMINMETDYSMYFTTEAGFNIFTTILSSEMPLTVSDLSGYIGLP